MLKAVIFDLDKTLHDKLATLRRAGEVQYELFDLTQYGITLAAWLEQFVPTHDLQIPKTETYARLAQRFSLPAALSEALREHFDRYSPDYAQPFAGMDELVDGARAAGLKTAILSNGRDFIQRHKLVTLRLVDRMDAIVISGSAGCKKPDERIFLMTLDALQVGAEEAVMIGDDVDYDIVPARALGLHTIWKSPECSALADFCSDSLGEIRTHLLAQLAQPATLS